MRSKYLLPLSLLLVTACGDDPDDAYIDPAPMGGDEEEPAAFSDIIPDFAAADSLWQTCLDDATFADATETVPTDPEAADYEDYYENWLEDSETTRDVVITYAGNDVTVKFLDDSKKTPKFVKITKRGAHVTIHNDSVIDGMAEGRGRMNYILRGSSSNGSLRIYSNKKFQVTLDGIDLTNAEGAAINVQKSTEKKRMFLCLNEGKENRLCDAAVYSDTIAGEDDKGTLFAEGKIILFGNGKLTVTGRYNHAIASDDDIRIHAGVTLTVDSARKDGIHVKDGLTMSGGLVKVFAAKDAIQCDTIAKGLDLRGGRLLLCGKRAVTANPFLLDKEAELCAIAEDTNNPTAGNGQWDIKQEESYLILQSE